MSSKDSTTLTNTREDYLDGASPKDYMTPWNQNPFNNGISLHWQSNGHVNYFIEHSLKLRPTYTGGVVDFEYFKMRTFCHYLLDIVPDAGLDEMKELIQNSIEFYFAKTKDQYEKLPDTSFEINIGESVERPIFHIAED